MYVTLIIAKFKSNETQAETLGEQFSVECLKQIIVNNNCQPLLEGKVDIVSARAIVSEKGIRFRASYSMHTSLIKDLKSRLDGQNMWTRPETCDSTVQIGFQGSPTDNILNQHKLDFYNIPAKIMANQAGAEALVKKYLESLNNTEYHGKAFNIIDAVCPNKIVKIGDQAVQVNMKHKMTITFTMDTASRLPLSVTDVNWEEAGVRTTRMTVRNITETAYISPSFFTDLKLPTPPAEPPASLSIEVDNPPSEPSATTPSGHIPRKRPGEPIDNRDTEDLDALIAQVKALDAAYVVPDKDTVHKLSDNERTQLKEQLHSFIEALHTARGSTAMHVPTYAAAVSGHMVTAQPSTSNLHVRGDSDGNGGPHRNAEDDPAMG